MKKLSLFFVALAASLGMIATAVPAYAVGLRPQDGYDIAWPQCNETTGISTVTQAPGAFSIIDINGGKVFTQNPCAVDQLKWAANGHSEIQLYANTGNPGGPVLSNGYQVMKWPSRSGIHKQRPCTTSATFANQSNCSYDYGWNAAKDSFARATAAFKTAGLSYTPKSVNWWLDLESTNTWRGHDPEYTHPYDSRFTTWQLNQFNIQAMRGQHDYLVSVAQVKQLGFYGSPNEWQLILSGTQAFADHPFWYPIGQGTNESALAACATARNVSGAGLPVMVQYINTDEDLDMSVRCDPQTTITFTGSKSVKRNKTHVLSAKLVATNSGKPLHGQKVTFTYRGKTYTARTDSSGVARVSVKAPNIKTTRNVTVTYNANSYLGSTVTQPISIRK